MQRPEIEASRLCKVTSNQMRPSKYVTQGLHIIFQPPKEVTSGFVIIKKCRFKSRSYGIYMLSVAVCFGPCMQCIYTCIQFKLQKRSHNWYIILYFLLLYILYDRLISKCMIVSATNLSVKKQSVIVLLCLCFITCIYNYILRLYDYNESSIICSNLHNFCVCILYTQGSQVEA